MEWVETTARTVEEAKDVALDQLGVDEAEAEFEVVEEPKAGLFGRVRREARVRARIRPTAPRPKNDRRDRRRRGSGSGSGGRPRGSERGGGKDRRPSGTGRGRNGSGGNGGKPQADRPEKDKQKDKQKAPPARAEDRPGGTAPTRAGGRRRGGEQSSDTQAGQRAERSDRQQGDKTMAEEVSLEEQAEIVEDFLDGLVDAFDLDGEVRSERIDEDTLEVQVNGDDLGLLIGPKGQTLTAVQELARTIVQRKAQGSSQGRLRIDVAGYRQKRREALERFTRDIAEDVKRSGKPKALEPMGSADRKVVHDTANEIDGVSTTSEGDEPRRRVVILPAD